jgi:hypothetical protein
MHPPKAREPPEVAVERHQTSTVLDGYGREVSIGRQVPGGA